MPEKIIDPFEMILTKKSANFERFSQLYLTKRE